MRRKARYSSRSGYLQRTGEAPFRISGMSGEQASDDRERIIADFDDPDPEIERLFVSLGRAVTATAAMEQALQIFAIAELTDLYKLDDPLLQVEMARFLKLTGGQVCKRLRELGLAIPERLAPSIDDAIERRNTLIHRSFRDLELARAAFENQSVSPLTDRMDQLARDCAGLMFDLERRAVPKLCASIGLSPQELLDQVANADPEALADPEERRQLRDLQAFACLGGLNDAMAELLPPRLNRDVASGE